MMLGVILVMNMICYGKIFLKPRQKINIHAHHSSILKMLENRPEDALGSLVKTGATVETEKLTELTELTVLTLLTKYVDCVD